ncbi:MAG: hypothetical protein KGM16_06930 [Bacteroidota bacterium]|nr:hypothetical protein [Bacteroidota bacterium]
MYEIKKILSKVSLLAIDIFLFGYNTIRQIILPGKHKKGNLLSTLFIFFVGIIERLGSFEYGIFRMGSLLKKKYIKQSLLIIAGLLFLLSSFEWKTEKNVGYSTVNYSVQVSDRGVENITLQNRQDKGYSTSNLPYRKYPFINYKDFRDCSFSTISASVKTLILIRSLRI